MYISTAILSLAIASTALAQEEGIIRTNLIRNPRHGTPYEVAKQRYQTMQKRMIEKRDPFNAPLYNDQGSQYIIEVAIGTPPQSFAVTLDTGSADLWVPSTQCPANNCPFYRFDVSKSSTFKTLNKPFGIQYGIGNVNGTYATDTVTVGGATVPNQQFGLASITKDILLPSPNSAKGPNGSPEPFGNTSTNVEANGILGMGYPSLTQANSQGEGAYNPFVFNLASQGVIKQPIFSIFLNSISKLGWAGEIIFGGIDNSKFNGELIYLPVASLTTKSSSILSGSKSSDYYYWMVYGQGLAVTDSPTGNNPRWRLREVGAYILDTGTTLTYLPTGVATEVVTAIAGKGKFALDRQSGVFIVDCATAKSSARFQLHMSQSSKASTNPLVISVPASELVIPIDGTTVDNAKTCMFGIAPMGSTGGVGSNMYLIGDSVLRSAYQVYDMGNNRVGLAANKDIGGTVALNSTAVEGGNNSTNGGTGSSSSNTSHANNVSYGQSLFLTGGALVLTAFTMATL